MKIVTFKELAELPIGTIFSRYAPCWIDGMSVRTGDSFECSDGEKMWNGTLDFEPMVKSDLNDDTILYTNWCTGDDSSVDYEKDQLFAIWSDEEVKHLIKCLEWALALKAGIVKDLNMDIWFGDPNGKLLSDDEAEERCGY